MPPSIAGRVPACVWKRHVFTSAAHCSMHTLTCKMYFTAHESAKKLTARAGFGGLGAGAGKFGACTGHFFKNNCWMTDSDEAFVLTL